jgi:hypothetical protein
VDESDGELTEEIRVKTAAAGLVFEGEDDEVTPSVTPLVSLH